MCTCTRVHISYVAVGLLYNNYDIIIIKMTPHIYNNIVIIMHHVGITFHVWHTQLYMYKNYNIIFDVSTNIINC